MSCMNSVLPESVLRCQICMIISATIASDNRTWGLGHLRGFLRLNPGRLGYYRSVNAPGEGSDYCQAVLMLLPASGVLPGVLQVAFGEADPPPWQSSFILHVFWSVLPILSSLLWISGVLELPSFMNSNPKGFRKILRKHDPMSVYPFMYI